jgi:hypothetical protein
MAQAIASADLASRDDGFRLVFHSIGEAVPGNAAAIAVGLGVPVTPVMEALYRAPSVLVDGLSAEIGDRMRALLAELGCRVTLDPMSAPLPAPAPLHDVALHISDTARYPDIVAALAEFLGMPADDAARLVATPPGIVLGGVTRATVDALEARLGPGADLVASEPARALYDLFLGPCDGIVRTRLFADLRRAGLAPQADAGCILTGLTKAQADAVWAAHGRIGPLRLVNRDFLRFDLVLTGGVPSPAAIRALTDTAGIPPHIAPRLFDEGEITVMEALPHAGMAPAMEALAAAGLDIRADLVTFLHLGVDVVAAPQPRALRDALQAMGVAATDLDLRRLPYRLPWRLPELQARLVRDTLEAAGAQADLVHLGAAEAHP